MSFASTLRSRNSERLLALLAAVALLMSLMVILAPPALAHHPEISATSICDLETGETTLTLSANSWTLSASDRGNHEDVRIEVSTDNGSTWHEVGSGQFLEGARSFTLPSFTGNDTVGPSNLEDLEGTTLDVRSRVVPADWDGDSGTSFNSDFYGPGFESGWYRWDPPGDTSGDKVFGAATGNGNNLASTEVAIDPCEPPPPPKPGTIVVVKKVTEGSDTEQVFTFTETGFSLDDDSLAHNESGSAEVEPGGDYSVSEDGPPQGWTLESSSCESTDELDDSTPSDINVSEGETVTCTFINDEDRRPPPDDDDDDGTTTTTTTTTTIPFDEVLPTVVTTTVPEVAPSTLPFTGAFADNLALIALVVIGVGLLFLDLTRMLRREE